MPRKRLVAPGSPEIIDQLRADFVGFDRILIKYSYVGIPAVLQLAVSILDQECTLPIEVAEGQRPHITLYRSFTLLSLLEARTGHVPGTIH